MRHLSLDQVRSLEDYKVIPGLRFGDVQDIKEARDKFFAALKSGESRLVRLCKLAEAYCWLFARSQRLTWALFALERSVPPVHDFTLQTLIATGLTFPGVDIAYVTLTRGRERYACAITAQKQSDPEGAQIVLGMCAWQDLPYLAMCFPDTSCVARVHPLVDDILQCKCDDIFVDCYTGIDQTLAQANLHHTQSASSIAEVLKLTMKV
ncbi:hypothetical protein MRX96_054180 [Rhipicephalus microplus]